MPLHVLYKTVVVFSTNFLALEIPGRSLRAGEDAAAQTTAQPKTTFPVESILQSIGDFLCRNCEDAELLPFFCVSVRKRLGRPPLKNQGIRSVKMRGALAGLACLAANAGRGQRQAVQSIAAFQQGGWMMKGGSSYTWLGLGYGERSKYSKKKHAKPELLFTGKFRTDVFGKQEMKKLRRQEDVVPAR